MPNSAQLRSSVCTWTRESSSRIAAARGVPSVGTLWSAVASVRSGRRTVRPASRRPVERLRAGHLVDEVQVDVEQAGRDLVGAPRSCRAASVACVGLLGRQLRRRPAETTASSRASPGRGSRSGGAGRRRRSRSRRGELVARPSQGSTTLPASTSAVSRLPGSCIGGSSAPPVTAPGASVCTRELGALARDRRRQHLVAVAARGCRRRGARRRARSSPSPLSSRRSSCERRSSRPGGDPRGDLQRRARLAALDL